MINIELTIEEKKQFQYILPIQGSIMALEMVENILLKLNGDLNIVEFEEEEYTFIVDMIMFLDNQKKLHFQSLSLIKKFLNTKKGE